MKKLFLFSFLCAMAMAVHAENTDISGIDNVVYVNPCTAVAGSEFTLSVRMKNTVEAESFGFDLVLPSGITVALDEYDDPKAELSTERTNLNITNHFDAAFKLDGTLNVQAYSSKGKAISGNDGEVALITLEIAADMQPGTYPLQLKNIAIGDVNSVTYTVDYVESSIEIVNGDEIRTVLDEASTSVPEATANAVDIKVLRTIKGGEWSTICLPFAMTGAEVTAAFGDDVQLADFVNYEMNDDATLLTVNFSDLDPADGMEANFPYLIKTSKDISEFTAKAVIEPSEGDAVKEYDNGKTGSRRQVYGTFYGTFHAGTVVPENCLFISDNKFWYSKGLTKMKAFRAYFDLVDILASVEGAGARIMMNVTGGETTGINTISGSRKSENGCYNLNGQRVADRHVNSSLKKGLYIVNGRKVVIE